MIGINYIRICKKVHKKAINQNKLFILKKKARQTSVTCRSGYSENQNNRNVHVDNEYLANKYIRDLYQYIRICKKVHKKAF